MSEFGLKKICKNIEIHIENTIMLKRTRKTSPAGSDESLSISSAAKKAPLLKNIDLDKLEKGFNSTVQKGKSLGKNAKKNVGNRTKDMTSMLKNVVEDFRSAIFDSESEEEVLDSPSTAKFNDLLVEYRKANEDRSIFEIDGLDMRWFVPMIGGLGTLVYLTIIYGVRIFIEIWMT